MDRALSLADGNPPTSRRQEGSGSLNSETVNGAELTDTTNLTPDQIDILQHPPLRSGLENAWPAGPRLATLELQPDDAESSSEVGPFLENHANGLTQDLMLQLYTDHSLLLHPQVPQPMQEQVGWGAVVYRLQGAAEADTPSLTPLTEIDEALSNWSIRGIEAPSDSEIFIVVFADGTWVLAFVWLIDTSTSVPTAH